MATRSEESRRAILNATQRLLLDEQMTVKTLSIEAIAREAGVGKTTIYRWWPSKAAVVIDAFVENHLLHAPIALDVPVREALRRHLRALIGQYAGAAGRLVSQLIAESQFDPATRELFRERFLDDRARAVMELVQRGIDNGELPATVDAGLFADMVYAPVYQRLLLGHHSLDGRLADALLDQALMRWSREDGGGRRSRRV